MLFTKNVDVALYINNSLTVTAIITSERATLNINASASITVEMLYTESNGVK